MNLPCQLRIKGQELSESTGYEPQYDDLINEPNKFFETAVTALHMEDSDYVQELPKDFYTSDFYASKLISYLSERTDAEKEKPFFAYLPFSAPHWPLQAPREHTEKYTGLYSDGPEALRLKRLNRLKELGLVSQDIKPHDVVVADGDPLPWGEMDSETRAKSARAMEVYAGMVDRMDWNIGKVLDHLKQTGQYDNTYIIFMSDNGAEGASYEAAPILGDEVLAHINKYYDNSLANIGNKDSFVWYGARWAQAATAPSRLYKMFSTEGGCRVPLILKPAAKPTQQPSFSQPSITPAFCTVMDIVPTFLDLAGLSRPGPTRKGRPILPILGKSWVPFLTSMANRPSSTSSQTTTAIHPPTHPFGFECGGSGALHLGDYKITYVPHPRGPQRWELFNITTDPGETLDLREREPKVFEQLLKLWEVYKKEVGVVGLAGEYPDEGQERKEVRDEFEDTGKWIKWIGKKEAQVPEELRGVVPM